MVYLPTFTTKINQNVGILIAPVRPMDPMGYYKLLFEFVVVFVWLFFLMSKNE